VLVKLWESVPVWRWSAGLLATLALALFVAAVIARAPPDFSAMPVVSVVRDGEQHPIWAIRLARAAHQIAADSLRPQPPPADRVYQLWLLATDGRTPRPLGLLPQSERKLIAVTPQNAHLLAGEGVIEVTLEPIGGSTAPGPSGPVLFRASLEGSG
jgi:anti-sigma-K factor RskA